MVEKYISENAAPWAAKQPTGLHFFFFFPTICQNPFTKTQILAAHGAASSGYYFRPFFQNPFTKTRIFVGGGINPPEPEGNEIILTGPSPVPEIQVAAATSPLRPLAHSVRTMAPSLATATLPPPWAGGAVTPTRPFPQPLGSPGGISCGGQVPAVPPLLPEGN